MLQTSAIVIAVNNFSVLLRSRYQLLMFPWALPALGTLFVAANMTTYANHQKMDELVGKVGSFVTSIQPVAVA